MSETIWPNVAHDARQVTIGEYKVIEGKLSRGDRRCAYAIRLVEPVNAPNAWGCYPTEAELAAPPKWRPVASFHTFDEGVRWVKEQSDV